MFVCKSVRHHHNLHKSDTHNPFPPHFPSTGNFDQSQELTEKAEKLHKRSVRAYTSLFDRTHGLMVPKTDQGRIVGGFQSIEWGKGYTEGTVHCCS